MSFWRFNIFKEDPKDLKSLRLHQDHKLAEYYASGSFWYTPASADGQPTMLISAKGGAQKDIKDAYKKFAAAKAPDQVITGTYKATQSGKEGIYELTADAAYDDDPAKKKVFDKIIKEKDFNRDLWSCFAMAAPKGIKFGTPKGGMRAVGEIKLNAVEWTAAQWDLTKVLTIARGQGVLSSEPLAGEWQFKDPEKKAKDYFLTAGGLKLPYKFMVEVKLVGAVVDRGEESELLQYFRDPITAIMAALGEELKEKLKAAEGAAAKEPAKDGKKPKAEAAANEAVAEFQKTFETQCLEAIEKRWFQVVSDHVELRVYEWEAKVAMTKQTIMLGLSIAGAAAGGITGVAAVFGLIGTIHSGLVLVRDLYTYFRDIAGVEKELGKDLARTLARYALDDKGKPTKAAGFEEAGKAFLEHLPGLGILVNDVLKVPGTKTTEALEKNTGTYKAKVTGSFVKLEAMLKQLKPSMEAAKKATAVFERPEIKDLAKGNAEQQQLYKNLTAALAAAEKVLDSLLIEITGAEKPKKVQGKFPLFIERRERVDKYLETLEEIKKGVPLGSKIFKAVAMPLLDLTWSGLDPAKLAEDLPNLIQTSASATLDIIGNCCEIADATKTKDGAALLKQGNDLANGIRAIVQAVKA